MRTLFAALALLGACGRDASTGDAGKGLGDHVHLAPRGGTLVELGEEAAHLELLLDAERGELTAFALDGHAERAVRLAQPSLSARIEPPGGEPFDLVLSAVARPDSTGETVGDTSEFRGASPRLRGIASFRIRFGRIEISGASFDLPTLSFPDGNHGR